MKLITEVSYDFQTNKDEEKNLYIEGIFSSANKKNRNGRIYPRRILEREISSFRQSIVEKTACGELNHPPKPDISLERAAILVEDLSWSGDDVYGKAKVLNTPCGKIARNLIEDGVRIGISSRGLGTVDESTNHVNEDYSLLTFDLVSKPSNHGSWVNGVYEGQDFTIYGHQERLEEQAKEEYKKRVWQVIRDIQKSL